MMKIKICDVLYDAIYYTDFNRNRWSYLMYPDSIAIILGDGFVYPIRKIGDDNRPGMYLCGGPNMVFDWFVQPRTSIEMRDYSQYNIIDFSAAHNLRDVIATQERLNREERSILTTINQLTVPEISSSNEPAMVALKEAIIAKHIDLDSYDYRFGIANFPNNKRLLKKDSISLKKLIEFCNALDIRATLTLADSGEEIANPMAKVITHDLNGLDTEEDDMSI